MKFHKSTSLPQGNVFSSKLLLNTIDLRSFELRDQVSYPYKVGKVILFFTCKILSFSYLDRRLEGKNNVNGMLT